MASVVAVATLLTSDPVPAGPAEDQYAVAAGLYAQQRWDLAAEQFQVFRKEYPDQPQATRAIFFLAEALLQLGKAEEAADRFAEYLNADPAGPFARPALFRTGEAAYLAGHLERARPDLERFLAEYPRDALGAYVPFYLGNIAQQRSEFVQAEGYYRQALKDFPQGAVADDCRFELARVLEKQGNSEEAERFYLSVAAKTGSPLSDDAQFHLGALQYASANYDEAIETFAAFESRLKESPWCATARLGHGWALLKTDRFSEAAAVFESIRSDPKLGIEARYWLGLTHKARKEWQTAATTLLQAADDAPDHVLNPAMRFHAADSMIRSGDFEAADAQFRQVIASAPSDNEWLDDAARGRVQAAFQTKNSARLDTCVEGFLTRFPQSPLADDVLRMAARSLLERKHYQRALDKLQAISTGDDPPLREYDDLLLRALCLEGLDRQQEALDVLLPVLQSARGKSLADAQLVQASLLLGIGRYAEAIPPLEAFLASEPTGDSNVKARARLAICYARTGRLDEAQRLHAALLAECSDHPLVATATEQLAEAAYDAGDMAWSERLFASMRDEDGSTQSEFKGLLGLGWSRYKAGRMAEAAETLAQLLAKHPPETFAAEAALLRGNACEQLGRDDEAAAMYESIVDRFPAAAKHPDALLAAALLYDRRGQTQTAATRYARLAADYPEHPQIDKVLYNWAWMLSELGRSGEAQSLFERLHQDHRPSPYWAHATLPLAQQAYEAGDYARAERLAAELIADTTHPAIMDRALYLGGQIAQAQDDWPTAAGLFEKLLADCPQSPLRPLAEYGLAEVAYRQDDYPEASRRFGELALSTDDGDPLLWAAVHLRVSQLLCREKQWDQALPVALRILDRYPQFEQRYEVDYVVGRCLSAKADFQGARRAYQRVIESEAGGKTETAAKAQLMIAESFYHQKNYEEAFRAYLRLEILYDYPSLQAAAVFQAAKCREMLGEWQDAAQLYDKLIRVYPDTPWAEKASLRQEAASRGAAPRPGV
jgi:TolA-binding protein